MKILYGVQATGNGHISRARAMGKYLAQHNVEVDYLFSGREASQFFDMQQFGNYQLKRGVTFISQAGKVDYWQSFRQASVSQLLRDIRELDVSRYDLVLTDFEPVTAHAARRAKKHSVAVGHQYAFLHKIPQRDNNVITAQIFKHFAPAQQQLGLHWHHFDQPILPPIIDEEAHDIAVNPTQVLVYLPFEDQQQVLQWLKPLTDFSFCVYGPGLSQDTQGHIKTHPPALQPFKADLASCRFVLSNAGFELISEALQLKKQIMVKPLHGQMEQQSNALALTRLNLASATQQLTTKLIAHWLNSTARHNSVQYPNVAKAICQWLLQDSQDANALIKSLW